jgi:hypothetical protein
MRDDRWVIPDLVGKRKKLRLMPVPEWVKDRLDLWTVAAKITEGKIFRAVRKNDKVSGAPGAVRHCDVLLRVQSRPEPTCRPSRRGRIVVRSTSSNSAKFSVSARASRISMGSSRSAMIFSRRRRLVGSAFRGSLVSPHQHSDRELLNIPLSRTNL